LTNPEADMFAVPLPPGSALPTVAEESLAPIQEPPQVEAQVPTIPLAAPTPVPAQPQSAPHQLLHLQSNTPIEIPPHLQVIHLGKPNDLVAPDIDVSSFACAEVVSRVHANIRIEGENYYIEDVGSANGTYINHNVLAKGNRHLLRAGDRIGLGKGDLVTFIFQDSPL
jgi:pSer/pThr/pTyr-binding forkhead associated (FHA) protein